MDKFNAIADPTRRDIIQILAKSGELNASSIYDRFSISSPAISQHLKVLRDTRLVIVEKRSQQRIYRINPIAISEFEQWVKQIKNLWEDRFERLDILLREEKI